MSSYAKFVLNNSHTLRFFEDDMRKLAKHVPWCLEFTILNISVYDNGYRITINVINIMLKLVIIIIFLKFLY